MSSSMFNQFVKKTKEATSVVGKKATELLEVTKVNIAIADLENEIADLYKEIGMCVFDAYQNDGALSEKINEKCETIAQKSLEIDALKQKLAALKSTIACPACSAQNDRNDLYCSQCGYKLVGDTYGQPNTNSDTGGDSGA